MFLKEYKLLGNLFGSKKNKLMRCIMTDLRKCNKRKGFFLEIHFRVCEISMKCGVDPNKSSALLKAIDWGLF